MSASESLVTFWYFHVPNLVLAALMYTLLGRFLLSLFFPPDSDKVIWRVFVGVTDPVIRPVRYITPAMVPARVVWLLAFVWLLLLRVILFLTVAKLGAAPSIGG